MTNKVYQLITDQIIKQLEQVDANDYRKPWFNIGHSPINIRGTAYRGINSVILGSNPSNLWATYNQWKKEDCHVNKGERGTPVVLWKFFKDEETTKTTGVMVRYYTVFNSDQVTGEYAEIRKAQLAAKLKDHNPIPEAKAFVDGYMKDQRLPLKQSDRAYYNSGIAEHIGMPDLGQFHDVKQFYSVFAHEIIHSTGNQQRLNRAMSGKFGTPAYAFEELVAELGSAMICGSLGLENKPRKDHAQYLKGWLSALKNDPKMIFKAASLAQKAVDYALEAAEIKQAIAA